MSDSILTVGVKVASSILADGVIQRLETSPFTDSFALEGKVYNINVTGTNTQPDINVFSGTRASVLTELLMAFITAIETSEFTTAFAFDNSYVIVDIKRR